MNEQDRKREANADQRELVGLIEEVKNERISRRQFVERALVLGLSASTVGGLLAACGNKKTETGGGGAQPTYATTKPAKISLYNWSDYMAPGTKKGFQKETGIEVVETFYDDNEALLSKLKAGATGYDVIVPSDYMVSIMQKTDLLLPLQMSLIPNYQYVDADLKNPQYDNPANQDGLQYSVPYQWGTTGYAVRTDKTDVALLGTWANLWEEKYRGQIDMLNDEREDLGAALMMLGFSFNTTDQGQLDQATQKLIEQKPLVREYDSSNQKRAIAGGLPITMCWNGDALMGIDSMSEPNAKDLVKFLLPTEGFAYWTDNFCCPQGAKSPYGAHLFMDYVLTPEVMGQTSSWTWYLPVEMKAAKPYTDPFVYTITPTPEEMKRSQIGLDLGEFGRNYTEAWTKVKGA